MIYNSIALLSITLVQIAQALNLSRTELNHHIENISTAKRIKLLTNNFDLVESDAFNELYQLIELDLSRSNITCINSGAFNDLWGLEKLSLQFNNLKTIPDLLFDGFFLRNLKYLDLSFNQIDQLKSNDFKRLHYLENLVLFNNQLKSFESNVFHDLSQLKFLDLGNFY